MEANNTKAMREALKTMLAVAAEMREEHIIAPRLLMDGWAKTIESVVESALSAPPRNCDVGTADEQEDRFDKFCDSHKWVDDEGANACMSECPLYNTNNCSLLWAQMPYKTGGGGAK